MPCNLEVMGSNRDCLFFSFSLISVMCPITGILWRFNMLDFPCLKMDAQLETKQAQREQNLKKDYKFIIKYPA